MSDKQLQQELQEEYNKYLRDDYKKAHSTKKDLNEIEEHKLKRKEVETDWNDDDFEGEEREDELTEEGEIEPFNLDREREEGNFDRDGNYTKFKREDGEKDNWIEMVENESKSIKNEKRLQEIKQKEIERVKKEEERCNNVEQNKLQVYQQIISLLFPNENSKKAICRLKKEKKLVEMNQLIDACGNLVDIGDYLIYEKTKEQLQSFVTSH
ncbi:hypothetical protein conserved [Entamoeba histolytica]|uniref:Uncharacterized protein n=2 Tax=Entamoeba histolytica TaxID=5759 RepID=B1N2Q4_ENTH1|nr:hypothetical protein, conserved [Entamoeba histolytica HM-1:IMSS]EDS89755.1 hypothetical protein, conserved [Entamoeba histolytica HM-1:IMSS]GAT92672.1 hypothetical protein conserved [Entamoeba histolytica]|eukprot:XP_001913470.1 hypothetical protein, conserved [Entamoeba histolytica HM-1:IMSS]